MSVIVTVPIPDGSGGPAFEQKACTAGMDRDQYVRVIVIRDLEGPRPLDYILRSFRDEATASQMAGRRAPELSPGRLRGLQILPPA
ncbi:MAG: hypothetical protein R2748_03815 [Bryobacterales bacterium]